MTFNIVFLICFVWFCIIFP